MCGIYGIWRQYDRLNVCSIKAATNKLKHRGPDDEGYLLVNTQTKKLVSCGGQETDASLNLPMLDQFQSESFDLAFGFRRLAILDLSPAGHQPMASKNGRYWIVYNGEIYNYKDLRAELSQYGYDFQTQTDTEVLLAAYQHWGENYLSYLNGMWAFAIYDVFTNCLFLSRDRFGIKPIYYWHTEGQFSFASEIKALIGQGGMAFNPDNGAIYNYLVYGQLPSARSGLTFFQGIHALPPGHWLKIDLSTGHITKQRYWTLPSATECNNDPLDVVDNFRELFFDAVRVRLRADVPVGTCLSGGVDSSAIVCVVNRLLYENGNDTYLMNDGRQKTFSAVYHADASYNERPHIDKILSNSNAEGNFIFPDVDSLRQDIDRLVWHQDEPFLSASIFAQFCVMRQAHECGVKVLLDGQGADEILAGYRPFINYLGDVIQQKGLCQSLKEAQTIQAITGLSAYGLLIRCILNNWDFYRQNAIRQRRIRNAALVDCLRLDFVNKYADIFSMPVDNGNLSLDQLLRKQIEEFPLPHLLRYEDRNSMAHSVEGRVPFLDYRLVEYMFKEAFAWRINQGWTKWPLRKAMSGIVPDDVNWRKDKVGFETPEEEWLMQWQRNNPDLFGTEALSGEYLNLESVRKKITTWRSGQDNIHVMWRWINLEIWLRVWSVEQ